MTELDRTVEYSYDSLYRLTSEIIPEDEKVTVYTYAYDNVSNRILKTENGAATEYVYNALNQLVSDSETSYEYDLNGNLVRVIGSAQSALYEYNAENKLVRATVQNGVLVTEESYTYDYEGNRTSKTTHRSDGVTEYVKYLNDNSSLTNVLAEMGSEGSVQAYYTIGADLISQERDGNVSVYLYDGHGSVVGLANESGKVTDTYAYDAFGNLISSTGSTENHYRYCGEQFDETTGLYYLRARYMNPSVGTFISMDSYEGSIDDPVSLHKYLYCNSDPVNNYDPSGYNTLAEMEATTGIQGVLNQMIMPNVKALMNLFDGLSAIWDIADTARTAWNDGLRGADLAISIACGVMTSILTNFSCQILALGPLGVALFAVGALVLGIGIGMALAEGDGSLALSRVAQLIGVLFSAFSPSCFTGDTVVLTSEGLTCIEDVEVGDSVWAYNSEIGKAELKEVLCVWVKETDKILHVSTSYGETIDTTTNHPFYVEEKGWVAAGDLVVGDTLVTVDGDEVEVTNVELEKLAEPILVYNLDVADFDTYFVGEYGALVHNYSKRNQKLAGKEHPVSGVLFDSDANPQFESFFDAVIDVENYTSSDKKQFDIANNQLKKAIMENESLKSIFDEKQIAQIMGGKKPSGYVWHHSQEPGVLQLVDEYIHKITGHTGGRSLWGGGSSFR